MKIILLSPPFIRGYMRNARCDFVSLSGTQWYPILLGYCGAWLEKRGHDVRLIDAPAYGLGHHETEEMIVKERPDWLVLYTGRLSEDNDISFADGLIERLGCRGIIVGPYASISPGETLRKSKNIELLVTGEFELPVQEIVEGKRDADIRNLVYRRGDEIVQNSERPYLGREQLDRIPFVSRFFRDRLDVLKYRTPSEPYPFMDMMTGRGCMWGRCTYCLWVSCYIKGQVYNCRSIENVMDEFDFISKEMPDIRSVMLQDDTLPEERAMEFSEAKLRAGIALPWSCYARGDISFETLKLMKRANCLNLHVGFESADAEILKRVKKGISVERMTSFAADAGRAGLRIHGDFAIGFPGETGESVRRTVEWARRIRPHTAQFQLMIPFPGTPFHEELREKGWLKDGLPDYPGLSSEKMEAMARRAYRKFYISVPFARELIRHPVERFFSKIPIYLRSFQYMFWRRYIR